MSHIEILHAIISTEYSKLRLDKALAKLFPDYSREILKKWILDGSCRVNGLKLRPRDIVLGGEEVKINNNLEEKIYWNAENLPINIIYEDKDLLVVNKPYGIVVHPAIGNYSGTLANALLYYAPELKNIPRAGIVHRLDKNTTGLLVIARNLAAYTSLVLQLQKRTIIRIYETVVHGICISGGIINEPIGRHAHIRNIMAVTSNGKTAITHYRIINKFSKHTHLQVKLETGRTHQIRVHMAYIKHPIVGDHTYAKHIKHNFDRQALHAKKLQLIHPMKRKEISWEIALPKDMQKLIHDCT